MPENTDPPTSSVYNLLPHRLHLVFEPPAPAPEASGARLPATELVFGALERRDVALDAKQQAALTELANRRLVEYDAASRAAGPSRSLEGLSGLLIGGFMAYLFIGMFINEGWPQFAPFYWYGVPALVVVGLIILGLALWKGATVLSREATQMVTLLMVLTIGIGVNAATIYFFADGQALLSQPPSLVLFARLLQLTLVAIAAILPGLLYFLFDREQLGTLRERFERQIFRLDPQVHNLAEVQVKYGSQLDEYFGRDQAGRRGRLGGGTRWPILVCTLALTAGWLLTLLPVGPGTAAVAPSDLLAYFLPQPAATTFGFLGAYYFALNLILRRYTRGDLQPKVYSHITVRIVVVLILGWVAQLLIGPTPYTYVFVFFSGIVPETFLTAIKEFYRNGIEHVITDLEEKHPLTRLEGIDLYDRSRLAEEGVTNVESLAHHDLTDLILSTRIPVARLVDWVDQAILYLHVDDTPLSPPASQSGDEQATTKPASLRQRLRAYGIRTATDFVNVYEATKNSQQPADLLKLLSGPEGASDGFNQLTLVYCALRDDEWMDAICHWRTNREKPALTILVDADGRVTEQLPATSAAST